MQMIMMREILTGQDATIVHSATAARISGSKEADFRKAADRREQEAIREKEAILKNALIRLFLKGAIEQIPMAGRVPLLALGFMLLVNPITPATAQNSGDILARKGNAQLIRQENEKAILTLSEALTVGSLPLYTKASILNDRALAYARIKKFERSLKDFNQAIETFPEFATAYNNRGLLLHQLGFYKEAIKDFDRAIALQPKLGATFHNRANALLKAGAEKLAFRDYGQALKLLNNKAPTHLARGQIHWSHYRHYAALRELNKALGESDNFDEIFYNRGQVYQSLGKDRNALEDFIKAAQLSPENLTYKMTLARIFTRERRFKEAKKTLTQILSQEPLNAEAIIMRGRVLGERGEMKRALNDLDQAVSLTDSAEAFAERAYIRARIKKRDEAIEDMDAAIQKAPKKARSWAILGETAMRFDLARNAERYFLEAQKIDKSNEMAASGLEKIRLREAEQKRLAAAQEGLPPPDNENPAIAEDSTDQEIIEEAEPTWSVNEYEPGKFVALHPAYEKLKVHLDLYGPNAPRILEWTILNGKYQGFALLRYDAGSKNKARPYEQVSVINLKKQEVLSIEPYRWGKQIAEWDWGDYDLTVKDPDGIENKIALRSPPAKRRAPPGVNEENWLFGNDGFWLSSKQKSNGKKRRVRVKKKKKKSLFGIFGF